MSNGARCYMSKGDMCYMSNGARCYMSKGARCNMSKGTSLILFRYICNCTINMESLVLYTNIDQTLLNKIHEPTYCKIGHTCVYNGHVFYTLLSYHDNLIQLFHNSTVRLMNSRVSGQCSYVYNIYL